MGGGRDCDRPAGPAGARAARNGGATAPARPSPGGRAIVVGSVTAAGAPRPGLAERFLAELRGLGLRDPNVHVLVALSGGRDSVVLLHLFRFAAPEVRVSAAHFDHALRPGSDTDARWAAGLCRAWEVPLVHDRAGGVLRGEDAARRARHRFLQTARRATGATSIATAHHADDQAETVLFRILRGTGIEGLAGMAPATPSGLVRPLLPFWRAEIDAYAREAGLRWRDDPSNRSLDAARNRIRREILLRIERTIAPAARRRLVSLAALARESETVVREVVARAEADVVRTEGSDFVLARGPFHGYDPAVGSRVLRNVLRHFGIVLDRAGTRAALQFIIDAPSGRELRLPGGVLLATQFDTVRVAQAEETPPDVPLRIPGLGEGGDTARIGGRAYAVRWRIERSWRGWADPPLSGWRVALGLRGIRFPLLLRGWEPGDRIRTPGGTKKLKKLFGERRVGRATRARLPVLLDDDTTLLWVAGLAHRPDVEPRSGERALLLTVSDD